jgi:hypothetical protein
MITRESTIKQLVSHAQRGFAVVVIGAPGTGKADMCSEAIKRMGLKPYTIHVDLLDMLDIHGLPIPPKAGECNPGGRTPGIFEKLDNDIGLIVRGLERTRFDIIPALSYNITHFVRHGIIKGKKKVVFIIVHPDYDINRAGGIISEWFGSATGEILDLERLVVEVPKHLTD